MFRLLSQRPEWNGLLPTIPDDATFRFVPHYGRRQHIERETVTSALSACRARRGLVSGRQRRVSECQMFDPGIIGYPLIHR